MKCFSLASLSKLTTLIKNNFITKEEINIYVPAGVIQAFSGTTVPSGWLLCDGSAISRTTYSSLFSTISTTYGTGNGSTTFNLPNLTNKFIQGSSTAGTTKAAGLPNITGSFESRPKGTNSTTIGGPVVRASGVFSHNIKSASNSDWGLVDVEPLYKNDLIEFNASRSSSVYGSSSTVQPPALTMKYIIKY